MGQYVIRRILTAIPTLIFISFVIFALLDLAPGDPTSNLPLIFRASVSAYANDLANIDVNGWDTEEWNIEDWSRVR